VYIYVHAYTYTNARATDNNNNNNNERRSRNRVAPVERARARLLQYTRRRERVSPRSARFPDGAGVWKTVARGRPTDRDEYAMPVITRTRSAALFVCLPFEWEKFLRFLYRHAARTDANGLYGFHKRFRSGHAERARTSLYVYSYGKGNVREPLDRSGGITTVVYEPFSELCRHDGYWIGFETVEETNAE